MSTRTSAQALAETTSALLGEYDVAGLLAHLLRDARTFVPAEAVALLVLNPAGELELLSATSHRAADLEVYQAQTDEGPCVEVVESGEQVSVAGAAAVAERWPRVGPQIVAAGFAAAHGFPLRWEGRAVGGLNLFTVDARELGAEARALAQCFADIATLTLTRHHLDDEALADRLAQALEGRIVVEQAKGVLAHQLTLDMPEAYDELLRRADEEGTSLTATAERVLRAAQAR